MATSMSLSHESNEAHEVEWPEDGEGDIQLLDENVTPGVNTHRVADPQSGEKVSPVKPRVLFGTLTSKEKLAADKAGLAISSPGSSAVTSPGAGKADPASAAVLSPAVPSPGAGKADPASAVPSSGLSPLPQVQLVKTKAQKKAAKAKVSPPTQAPDSSPAATSQEKRLAQR